MTESQDQSQDSAQEPRGKQQPKPGSGWKLIAFIEAIILGAVIVSHCMHKSHAPPAQANLLQHASAKAAYDVYQSDPTAQMEADKRNEIHDEFLTAENALVSLIADIKLSKASPYDKFQAFTEGFKAIEHIHVVNVCVSRDQPRYYEDMVAKLANDECDQWLSISKNAGTIGVQLFKESLAVSREDTLAELFSSNVHEFADLREANIDALVKAVQEPGQHSARLYSVAGHQYAYGSLVVQNDATAKAYMIKAWRAGQITEPVALMRLSKSDDDPRTAYFWSLRCIKKCADGEQQNLDEVRMRAERNFPPALLQSVQDDATNEKLDGPQPLRVPLPYARLWRSQ